MDRSLMDSAQRASNLNNDDAFEAIFALNMGDFVAEHFISQELMGKINESIAQNPERLLKQLEELVQIYSLDKTLSLLGFHANQGFVLYDSIAMSLTGMLQIDACHIFQTMTKDDKAQFLSLTGTSVPGAPENRWNIGYDLGDSSLLLVQAYEDDFPLVLPKVDAELEEWHPLKELHQDQVKTLIAVPMSDGQKRIGLMLFESYEAREFSPEAVDLAEATANVFVVSLRLQHLLDQAQKLIAKPDPTPSEMKSLRAQLTEAIADLGRQQQFFVVSLSYAIDARQEFMLGHSQGVALVAKQIAECMGLNEKTVDLVYYAGLLCSLGKINIPPEILSKEEALTPQEREALKNSPNIGVGLLMKMNFLAEVIPYVDYQKERWDGRESPHGLSGRSIPIGARIIAVADAYHALTHPRPYRERPLTSQEALAVLQSEAGTKWDPDVVDSLAQMVSTSAV